MEALRFFRGTTPSAAKQAQATACLQRLRERITAATGVEGRPVPEDMVRFGGSEERPLLVLSVCVVQFDGREWLYGDVDDETSWQEWDFPSVESFEESIVTHVISLVGQVVKEIRETKRFRQIQITTYRQVGDAWELLEEETVDSPLLRLFLWKNKVSATVKDYRMNNRPSSKSSGYFQLTLGDNR